MGRKRKAAKMKLEGRRFVAYIAHPLTKRTARFYLGEAGEAQRNLDALNVLHLNEEYWRDPPEQTPQLIRDQWLGEVNGVDLDRPAAEKVQTAAAAAGMQAKLDAAEDEIKALRIENKQLRRQLRQYTNKKFGTGPGPTLKDAAALFMSQYTGRDDDKTKIVGYDVQRFVDAFGASTPSDSIEGRERDVDAWLRGLTTLKGRGKDKKSVPLGAARRADIRKHVLKFLEASGVMIDRKAVPGASKADLRADRGQIRWLSREQARAVADALPEYFADLFRVQVATGMRPDELVTLKRADFNEDCSEVTLAPLKHLTLKLGSRTIKVPAKVRRIVKRRIADNEIVFPDPKTAKPWSDVKRYNRRYREALKGAGEVAGVPFKVDCRAGRRTCASLLLRAGHTAEAVGAVLGDDPKTIREHYGRILDKEVDPSKAAI